RRRGRGRGRRGRAWRRQLIGNAGNPGVREPVRHDRALVEPPGSGPRPARGRGHIPGGVDNASVAVAIAIVGRRERPHAQAVSCHVDRRRRQAGGRGLHLRGAQQVQALCRRRLVLLLRDTCRRRG
ncbi:unnamed protein product, partial [Ectocarpus sp. 12 AP-2014]